MVDKVLAYLGAAFLLSFSACQLSEEKILPPSSGNSGDLVVVMDSAEWAGELGSAIYNCFAASQAGLPKHEPIFSVINVDSRNFGNIFKKTRNILIVSDQKNSQGSSFAVKEDMWAKDQLVLFLFESDQKGAAQIIEKNCAGIVNKIKNKEYGRLQTAFKRLKEVKSTSRVKELFGIDIQMPADYKKADEKNDFIWFRKDFERKGHFVNMGLLIYRFPYADTSDLSDANLLKKRDIATQNIEGPSKNSHMVRYENLPPSIQELNIAEKYAKEMRGLWRMNVDFMGGPFVNYSFISPDGSSVICIDAYVFAPQFDKREYLRELEAIALSAIQ